MEKLCNLTPCGPCPGLDFTEQPDFLLKGSDGDLPYVPITTSFTNQLSHFDIYPVCAGIENLADIMFRTGIGMDG